MSSVLAEMPSMSGNSQRAEVRAFSEQPRTTSDASSLEVLKDLASPFVVSKQRAFEMTSYPKLVQRWLYWSRRASTPSERWIIIVREGGRGQGTLIDFGSLKRAYERFLAGDQPPPMPSERRHK